MGGLNKVIQSVRALEGRLCSVFYFVLAIFLMAFLLFSVEQGFIAQIHPALVWLCFDFQWSSFLSRNKLKKEVTMNVFRNQMAYGSAKGSKAGTKCRRCGHITWHSIHLLYIDKPEVSRLSTVLLISNKI